MQGYSNQGYTKPACASTEICSALLQHVRVPQNFLQPRNIFPRVKFTGTRGVTDPGRSSWMTQCQRIFLPTNHNSHSGFLLLPVTPDRTAVWQDTYCNYSVSAGPWPRGPRRRSAAARLLRLWAQIPPGAWISVLSVVCCQVEVSATR